MAGDKIILWEAHRGGGGYELPEATPIGFEYAWMIGGTPEADVISTRDGILMSLHDGKLGRTARNVSEEVGKTHISQLDYKDVRKYDIGNEQYPGMVVPTIDELLSKLHDDPKKEIVIDYKNAPLDQLAGLINRYGVSQQVTFATTREDVAEKFKSILPSARIKIWLGGAPEEIMKRFDSLATRNFSGFEQIQLHLNDANPRTEWRYQLSPAQVKSALLETSKQGVLLQTLPWHFEKTDLFAILDLGVRSFAVDYPGKFSLLCAEYFANRTWKPVNC